MPKLGSKKSRAGCKKCKERRVKCDEVQPRCGACTKYDLHCEFTHRISAPGTPHSGRNGVAQPSAPNGATIPNTSLLLLADAATSAKQHSIPGDGFTLIHLELLHYYLTEAVTAFSRPNTEDLWLKFVPSLGYNRPWLMKGLIAIAGLQKAHYTPDRARGYVNIAMDSLSCGLQVLQSWAHTPHDTDGAHAIVALACIVAIYAIALPAVQYREQPPEEPLITLFHAFDLLASTKRVYELVWDVVQDGPMKEISQVRIFDDYDPNLAHLAPTAQRRELLQRVQRIDSLLDTQLEEDRDKMSHCRIAHENLGRVMHNVLMANDQIPCNIVLGWAATSTSEFRRLLRDGFPPAMTLLVFYSLLLRDDVWYTKGWRYWTVDAVSRMGTLDQPWQSIVQWAEDQVHADPQYLDLRSA